MSRFLSVLSFMIFCYANVEAQDITLTFANAEITNDLTDYFYEADIQIASSTDFYVGAGQVYITYNTTAFGTNISANGVIEYSQPAGSILGQMFGSSPGYFNFIQNDNTASRVSLSFQQNIAEVVLASSPEIQITSTPKTLFHIKMKFFNPYENADICFYNEGVFQDQFFTACGGSDIADCGNSPGIQLINDTYDCSGSIVSSLPPIITLLGDNPQIIELGDGYTELGATINNDTPIVIDTSDFVDAVGTYSILYNATDELDSTTVQVIRTVNVVNTTAPIITLNGPNPQIIELGDGYTELGATTDDGSAVVIDASDFTDAVGIYSVLYDSTDNEGNVAEQIIRTVNVIDSSSSVPVITLFGSNPQYIELSTGYTELGATTDNGSEVVIDASGFTDAIGTYSIFYSATSNDGVNTTQVIRTVIVEDTKAPIITLLGNDPQYIELGAGYTELGATTDDDSPVVIDASEFADVVGAYGIYYNATDNEGNQANEKIRKIYVVDTTEPIITLIGDNPQFIELGQGYNELGTVTSEGYMVTVDTSDFIDAIGTYNIIYTARDYSDNVADQMTRVVNVVDETLSLGTIDANQIALQPNPTSDLIHISGVTSDYEIRIYDLNGKLVLERESNSTNLISTYKLSSGIYIIKLSNDSGNAIKRLIKN